MPAILSCPRRRFAMAAALALASAAGLGSPSVADPAAPVAPTAQVTAVLTPDGGDRFVVEEHDGSLITRAPSSNRSSNLRVVGYQKAAPPTMNQESCVTWVEGFTGLIQPGVALRVSTVAGRTRAITITNNILYGVRWRFNVHLVDSGARAPLTQVASVAMGSWTTAPLPWRICGRADGRTITVKAWATERTPEPAWDDPDHAFQVTVPGHWAQTGRPGWYVGHLAAGERLVYTDQTTAARPRTAVAPRPGASLHPKPVHPMR